jgi:hypothetical protein
MKTLYRDYVTEVRICVIDVAFDENNPPLTVCCMSVTMAMSLLRWLITLMKSLAAVNIRQFEKAARQWPNTVKSLKPFARPYFGIIIILKEGSLRQPQSAWCLVQTRVYVDSLTMRLFNLPQKKYFKILKPLGLLDNSPGTG